MNPQLNPLPTTPPPAHHPAAKPTGTSFVTKAIIGILLFAVLALIVVVIMSYSQAQSANSNLNKQKTTAYNQGKQAGEDAQKASDDEAAKATNQNPYKAYKAPVTYGDFQIKFPKDWSSWVKEDQTSSTQVDFIASPDIVKVLPSGNVNYALHVTLINSPYATYKSNYDNQVKAKKATAKSAHVFGLDGTRYEGQYAYNKTGILVVVPVRDKTMVFACENTKYQPEFETTLAQSIINP